MEGDAGKGSVVRLGAAIRMLGILVSGLGLLALVVLTLAAIVGTVRFPSPLAQGQVDYVTAALQLALLAAAGGGIASIGRRIAGRHARPGEDSKVALVELLQVASAPRRHADEPTLDRDQPTPERDDSAPDRDQPTAERDQATPDGKVVTPLRARRRSPGARRRRARAR